MNVLISACLLGVGCRYDGQSKGYDGIAMLMDKYNLIPVCPEIMGGLQTPRAPAEIVGDKVICDNGSDVTNQYNRGAQEVLCLARLYSCGLAILKSNSPSCSCHRVYDGTFTRTLVDGMGVTAQLLSKSGIRVVDETEIFSL